MVRLTRNSSKYSVEGAEEEECVDMEEGEEEYKKSGKEKGPPRSDMSMDRRVLLAKAGSLSVGCSLHRMPHPKTGQAVLMRVDKENCDEVLSIGDEYRSWLCGESVVGDGRLMALSPIHPLFLALPYLEKHKARFEMLEEILRDAPSEGENGGMGGGGNISLLAANQQLLQQLNKVADVKEVADEVVYRLSEERTLAWLAGRHSRLKQAIRHALHSGIRHNEEVLARYVFNVLCDWLSPDMAATLKMHLKIVDAVMEERVDQGMKRKAVDEMEELLKPQVKKSAPTESVQSKRLKAASKGTKSLSSFFSPKPNKEAA